MVKKMYSAPALKSENVQLGVFGCYGQPPAKKNHNKKKMWFGWFGWWF